MLLGGAADVLGWAHFAIAIAAADGIAWAR
jgi:hypothetical protein